MLQNSIAKWVLSTNDALKYCRVVVWSGRKEFCLKAYALVASSLRCYFTEELESIFVSDL